MRSLYPALVFLLSLPAQAATVDLTVSLRFEAVKAYHICNRIDDDDPDFPGHGNCGPYQSLLLGEIYSGEIVFFGGFETHDGVHFSYMGGAETCSFGGFQCYVFDQLGSKSSFSEQSISYRPYISSFSSEFHWDLSTGTGWHKWTDDDAPYWGHGTFDFSNIQVTGLPHAPLPASLWMLLSSGCALLAASRLKARRRG